ncbi:male sterility protein-domain-containing protein [Hysterangium stoloniferum]|nr:male sterility protein-domain-containing protein [Hysterangium stoloniferum]
MPKVRIANELREKGVDPNILDTTRIPLVYLKVDLSRGDLGLDAAAYTDLRDNVTHIIHSAWLLNFTVGLDAYVETHIAGVRNIIDLALSSPQKISPRLIFLSTLAAAIEYKGASKVPSIGEPHRYIVPESPVDDPSMASRTLGYGQSKYVSERIIVNAIEHGLRATISRVGQLGGMSTTGYWSRQEYGAILMKLVLRLGMFPTDFPVTFIDHPETSRTDQSLT